MMKKAGFDQASLVATVREMQQQVTQDLGKAAISRKLKPLKPPAVPAEPSRIKAEEPESKRPKIEKKEQEEDDDNVVLTPGVAELAIEAEALMNKNSLMSLHGMRKLPKGDDGRVNPVYCPHCNTTLEAKGRAKVWQHVRGQAHRALRNRAMQKEEGEDKEGPAKIEPADAQTLGVDKAHCQGLRLNSDLARNTRLGSDLRPVWEAYGAYHDFSPDNAPKGVVIHKVTKVCNSGDWVLQHRKCTEDNAPKQVRRHGENEATCYDCFNLASDPKFISRIAGLLLDMEAARILWHRMFAQEKLPGYIEQLKQSTLYLRRSKSTLDHFLGMTDSQLHAKVSSQWFGRSGNVMVEAMKGFYWSVVKPCLEVEPGCSLRDLQLQKLLDYMRSDPNASSRDLAIVKSVVTGELHRHPAIQGIMLACMNRVDKVERGNNTFRNKHRDWSARVQCLICKLMIMKFN